MWPRLQIRTNTLLLAPGPSMELDEALLMHRELSGGDHGDVGANLAEMGEWGLRKADELYGSEGVFRLIYMAMSHQSHDFHHFFDVIQPTLHGAWFELIKALGHSLLPSESSVLECDNERLPQSQVVERFNSNILQPSLSRKLYNPGRHHGYLVYGLGGPRILVSHPFRGIKGETYNLYENAVDVVTSLLTRGYHGRFLFLDNMPGLDYKVRDVPAWLVWFSIIATHSDLVVYVKEFEGEFGVSQQGEIGLTPDRVQKKLVEIPHDELRWAKEPESGAVPSIYASAEGMMTREEYLAYEREHAGPVIDGYARDDIPHDHLYRIDEAGGTATYPLDHPIYGPPVP